MCRSCDRTLVVDTCVGVDGRTGVGDACVVFEMRAWCQQCDCS